MTGRVDLVLNALSAVVPADDVASVANLPGVEAVYPDELLQLETDTTPGFIGATSVWTSLGGQESAGEGVIVGVLDTGVWPEHPSFSDPDPSGKAYTAPAPPLSGTRACEFTGGAHPGPAFACNNKLIAADRFMATYDALVGLIPGEFTTARDDNGHGTHTSSTSAGNAGVSASIFGISRGTVSGIAPRAHVEMFKVCGESGCFGSDSVAAVQQAITDGVNVINFSISGGANPYSDPVELAFLDAYNAGVFVSASAGNSGPTADTVAHRGPWVTSVAASTAPRAFVNTVNVNAGGLTLSGTSLTAGVAAAPIVDAGAAPNNDPFCINRTADAAFAGKIVVCQRGGGMGRVQKGFNVLARGAVGMVLYNDAANVTDLETDNHFLPDQSHPVRPGPVALGLHDRAPRRHRDHLGRRHRDPAGRRHGLVQLARWAGARRSASASRTSPHPASRSWPGHTPASVDLATGPTGELFQAIAGTSMSSPHIAGSGALVKALHPSWTPGQIKSALMTTAQTAGLVKEDGTTPFDAFDAGSGRVNLNVAGDPGLTFDVSGADYLAHAADLYTTNYPSIYHPTMPGLITLTRTAHNLQASKTEWKLKATSPSDFKISLPSKIKVNASANASFSIKLDASAVPLGQTRFATITLTQSKGGHRVLHLPVTIVRGQATLTWTKSCTPTDIAKGATTSCTLTLTNPTLNPATYVIADKMPSQLKLDPTSIVGGFSNSAHDKVKANGTIPASQPPNVVIAPGSSPAGGYVSLSAFGITPIAGVGDDTVTNFDVPGFTYAGQTYTRVGVSSNGYVVIGGATGADNSITNQNFPDATRPNNTLAAFWTDLNPGAAGAVRVGTLTNGADTWIVVDWNAVREFSAPVKLNTFEIWIGLGNDTHPGEDVSYAYGTIQGSGDGGFLSVGAENKSRAIEATTRTSTGPARCRPSGPSW